MPGGYSIEEFRAVPCHHFLFSAICFGGFATGYLHTRETNLEGRFPYFALGAVLGGIHFILMLVASTFNDHAKNKDKWTSAPKTIGFYRLLMFILLPVCIAGAILTAINGFCQRGEEKEITTTITTTTTTTTTSTNLSTQFSSTTEKPEEEDEPCYFYENYEVNLATAIGIVVMHAFSFFYSLFILKKSGETEQKAKQLAARAAAPPPKTQTTAAPKPPPKAHATTTASNPQSKIQQKPDGAQQNKILAINKTSRVSPARKNAAKTDQPKVTPDKTDQQKVTTDKTVPKTIVTANIVVNTIGSDINRVESYSFQTQEEESLRLLRLHQEQEALRNPQLGAYSGGFDDDGRAYTPSYPPPPLPPPPSYDTVMAGAYPSSDPLEAVVLEPDPSEMFPFTPGPQPQVSREYTNISQSPYQLSTDLRPPPVASPNSLNTNHYLDSNV